MSGLNHNHLMGLTGMYFAKYNDNDLACQVIDEIYHTACRWLYDTNTNNGWLSVNDELLKQYANKDILIYTEQGYTKKAMYSVDDSPFIDDDGKEYQYPHWFSNEYGDFMWEFDEVKYWQPLPNPPQR